MWDSLIQLISIHFVPFHIIITTMQTKVAPISHDAERWLLYRVGKDNDIARYYTETHDRELYLNYGDIGDYNGKCVSMLLSKNNNITNIDLNSNDFSGDSVPHLASLIFTNNTITDIYLGFDNIDDDSMEYLSSGLSIQKPPSTAASMTTSLIMVGWNIDKHSSL